MGKSIWDILSDIFSYSPIGTIITVIVSIWFAYVLFSGAIFNRSKEEDKAS